ncbi:MAG: hypothetical protein WB988_18320 [Candidatus Nitrosopolaris sp.]|jgi:hypothetical protein
MDTEEQIRRIFDNEIRYDIGNNSGTEDYIPFIIEDDIFLVGDLRSTVSWSLLGQHVILYFEILNDKSNGIDFNLILCPNDNVEHDIIIKMRNISSLNINVMGEYRSTRVAGDITSDQDSAIKHFVSNTLSFVGLNDAYNKNLQMDVIRRYCPTCPK